MKFIIATTIAALTLTATAAAQRSSPSNYSISSPTAGDLHSAWTNPEWKYRGGCDQVVVTYRVAVPFQEMVRKHPMGECSVGKHEWDEPLLPPGMYEQGVYTGITWEWEATTGFTGPSLNDVPPMTAGPVEVR